MKHNVIIENYGIRLRPVTLADSEFIVNLRVIENQSSLIDLNLNVSSEKQAQQICNNWKNNASYMYAEIIDLLIKENH